VVALAAAAGVAIDNARLYEEARRQERWLRATTEITRELLSGMHSTEVLNLVARQALALSGADLVALAVPAGDQKRLVNTHAAGEGADGALGLVLPVAASMSGQVLASGEAVVLEDFRNDGRVNPISREHMPLGWAILLPLGAPGKVRGVLTVGRDPGSLPFPPQGNVTQELIHRQTQPPPSARNRRPDISPDLDAVVKRMMALEPDDRYAAPAAVLRALLPFRPRDSRRSSPCDCREKIADRISLIVSSRASTALLTRSATSGRAISGTAPCSDIPVA